MLWSETQKKLQALQSSTTSSAEIFEGGQAVFFTQKRSAILYWNVMQEDRKVKKGLFTLLSRGLTMQLETGLLFLCFLRRP